MTRPFHHFLPKVVLRGFCIVGSESVWYCERKPPKPERYSNYQRKSTPERRNIATVFGKRGLNTYIDLDGNENSEIERYYSKSLENKWQPALIAGRSCSNCSDAEYVSKKFKRTFAEALYFSARRSPDLTDVSDAQLYEQYEEFVTEALRKSGHFRETNDEDIIRFLLSRRSKEAILSEVRVVGTATPISSTIEAISASHMVFLSSPSNRNGFIVSSCPVLRINPNLGFDGDLPIGFQTYMPISSRICIGFVRNQPLKKFIYLNNKQVRELNSQLAIQSSSIAAASKENLLRYVRLLKKRSFVT